MTVKDMLTVRMRLAYLNSEAAKQAIPKVAAIMAKELGWSKKQMSQQVEEAKAYIGQFGGPIADKSSAELRSATFTDLHEMFLAIDKDHSGYIDMEELNQASIKLGFPFRSKAQLAAKFKQIDVDGNGKISEAEFIEWWNGRHSAKGLKRMQTMMSMSPTSEVMLEKTLFADEKKK